MHSATGMAFRAFRPRLADFVLKMPRGAQVVYPKDVGAILVGADVFPGARVLEAGTGSGSLTLALCRATGAEGRVVSYDLRPEFQAGAARNIESFFGKAPDWLELREGDVRDVAVSGEIFDRAILDLPEPWATLEPLATRAARGRDRLRVPADDEPGPAARPRVGGQRVRASGDVRGAASLVARDRSERPAGSADGGAHRVRHARASRLNDRPHGTRRNL